MARAVVGIQNLIQPHRIIAGGFNDFAVCKLEFHIFKSHAVIQGRSVIADRSVYGVADRGAVNLTVRNVFLSGAFLRTNSLD
ncbi:hypothetical protein D3C81_2206080 [compost metagenome]